MQSYSVFLHAQRYQWHNDDPMFDGVPPIQNLQLDAVDIRGYVSMRCTFGPGCPVGPKPRLKGKDKWPGHSHVYTERIKEWFPNIPIPRHLGARGGGQFAVSKAQIQARSLRDYEQYREWIWHSGYASQISGTVMEYLWHMIFGRDPIDCMPAPECFCQNFGLCDLKCPHAPANCDGRVIPIPAFGHIPDQWPKQGQGKGWLPKDRWWEEIYPPELYDGFHLRANATQAALT